MLLYKITNLINRKIYIGITTTSINKRIASYKAATKKNNKHRIVFAMAKYGFDNFKFEVLYEASDKEDLRKKEIEYISLHKSTDPSIGYNVSPGGFLPSEDQIRKNSEINKGKKLTKEHRDKISQSLIGHRVSEKVIEHAKNQVSKIAGWNKGTKGVMKPNSGSFSSDRQAPNKGRKRIVDQFGRIRYIRSET